MDILPITCLLEADVCQICGFGHNARAITDKWISEHLLWGELADRSRVRLAFGPRLIIFEDFSGLLACEPPIDFYPIPVLVAIPDLSFPLQLT